MTGYSLLTTLGMYLLVILLPLIVLYLSYLLFTDALERMGFSSIEATLILVASLLLGSGIVDQYTSIPFAAIPLFTYNTWIIAINTGGAIIPILLSIYLSFKHRLKTKPLLFSILLTSIITFFVTSADPEKGIVSSFPFWLFPAVAASFLSLFFQRKSRKSTAPFAYITGTLGVLIGADVYRLPQLIGTQIITARTAIIGGASVFDMVFITGVLAVIIDSALSTKE